MVKIDICVGRNSLEIAIIKNIVLRHKNIIFLGILENNNPLVTFKRKKEIGYKIQWSY